jgi:phosphohistidine phosphatase SixA
MKRILVFVVRHGEREDEVQADDPSHRGGQYRKVTKEDRADPNLTVKGFSQASAAFGVLLEALIHARIEKVAVFTSPLRRAIGTAMMLGDGAKIANIKTGFCNNHDEDKYSGIKFVLPTADSGESNSRSTKETDDRCCIPIVVHNGLCDCTALVARLGGNKNLIRAGLIPFAALPSNAIPNDKRKAMLTRIEQMRKRARGGEVYKPEMHSLEDIGSNDESCIPVQFWKVENDMQGSGIKSSFVALTPKICLNKSPHGDNIFADENITLTPSLVDHERSPIDQVVRMAFNSGCDACIVSSHREEIRELCKERCGLRHLRIILSYCCIGSFEVLVDEQKSDYHPHPRNGNQFTSDNAPLQWILHSVTSPDEFSSQSVSEMLSVSLSNPGDDTRLNSFPITYPVIERTTLHLCHAKLVLDDLAAKNAVIDIANCSVTGIHAAGSSVHDRASSPNTFSLNFQIIKGYHSWLEFLQRLHDDVAHGYVEFYRGDRTKTIRSQLFIRPDQQHPLPCPAKTIRIEVLPST